MPTETTSAANPQASHWKHQAKDPCFLSVREERKNLVEKSLQKESLDRIAYITDCVRGKRTLDIGCVEHDSDHSDSVEWLHGYVKNAASYCLGLDIIQKEVDGLLAKGFHVLCHDITRSPVDEKFEVIVCGEIVEHIGSIDGLLENCRRCLQPGGQLILSTPYPWFIGISFRHTFAGMYFPGSVDHVTWYDPSNIAELAARHGYVLEMCAKVNPLPQKGGMRRQLFEKFTSMIRRGWIPFLSPLSGCRSLLYVLKAAE